jgi:S1-C subfamily serine protease
VVKVFCTHSKPNFSLPWQKKKQVRSTGSGFCIDIERRAILTNAHCIEWHAQVKVQRRGSDIKYLAKVMSVGWDCDCALLSVEDDEFWKGMQKVELSQKIPHLEDPILCVGFPVGGDTISVSSGVISRIEVMPYAQTGSQLLGIQIDAAINDGNSGGPAFGENGQCQGMAFQSVGADKAENVGYIIPTVVIHHFLKDLLKHGKYTGFPTLGVEIQPMENAHLRAAYSMGPKQKGVLVTRVAPTSAAAKVLRPDDVLLAFDSELIANDGTVRFRRHERVAFIWLVAQKFYGEPARLSVLREGHLIDMTIENFQPEAPIVPVHLFNVVHKAPSYLIVAGLVFTTLSVPFLRSEFGEEWDMEAPPELVHRVMYQQAQMPGESLVVLTQGLAHDMIVGYEELENVLLCTVNDTQVRNLQHTRDLLEACDSEFLNFGLEFQGHIRCLVLKTKAAREATAEVLEQHGVPSAMSPDLSSTQAAAQTTEPDPAVPAKAAASQDTAAASGSEDSDGSSNT